MLQRSTASTSSGQSAMLSVITYFHLSLLKTPLKNNQFLNSCSSAFVQFFRKHTGTTPGRAWSVLEFYFTILITSSIKTRDFVDRTCKIGLLSTKRGVFMDRTNHQAIAAVFLRLNKMLPSKTRREALNISVKKLVCQKITTQEGILNWLSIT